MFKNISTFAEPKVIGVRNGIFQLEFQDNDLRKNSSYARIKTLLSSSIDTLLNQPDEIRNISFSDLEATLLPKAKVTDIMGFAPYLMGYTYVVSKKFVSCLKEFPENESDYALKRIIVKGLDSEFYLLFVPMIPYSEIVFDQSLMYPEIELLESTKNYLKIRSLEEYKDYVFNNPSERWEKIVLKDIYNDRLILRSQPIVDLFFNDNLIDCLQNKGITNLKIKSNCALEFNTLR